MVVSLLNPKLNYPEYKNIHIDDVSNEVSVYEVPFFGQLYDIGLGSVKSDYIENNILHVPIYLIVKNKVVEQIGLYEVNGTNMSSFLDEDGDIDIGKMNDPLLFSYVNKEYLHKINRNLSIPSPPTFIDLSNDDEQDESTEVPMYMIPIHEQTVEQSKKERNLYKPKKGEPWIRSFLKNDNIDEVDNEGGGHCLFAVIRDAYATRGINMSVKELREKLSNYATQDQFQYYRGQYEMYRDAVKEIDVKLKSLNKQNELLRKKIKEVSSREQQLKLVEESQVIKNKYDIAKEEKKFSAELGNEFSFMKKVSTLIDFKKALQDPSYWADAWAISSLESILNVKLILFSQEAYDSGDMSNVLLCGESGEDVIDPKEYIMAFYTGNHYMLITYYEHGLLDFSQIPYDVKLLIINKCMEKLAGPYYDITAFRLFREKLGIKDKVDSKHDPIVEIDDIHTPGGKHDIRKDIVFQFYSNSSDKKKPGMGVGEKIPKEDLLLFTALSGIKDWRRKLDNSWEQAFELDGHKWKSVEHFYNASKFLKNHPDYYLQFSLDSSGDSDLSKDVSQAVAAGSVSGKLGKQIVRPKEMNMDEDFLISIGDKKSRSEKEMRRAIEAKMTQNKDLKKLLLETKNATLNHFQRGKEPVIAEELMDVRRGMQ